MNNFAIRSNRKLCILYIQFYEIYQYSCFSSYNILDDPGAFKDLIEGKHFFHDPFSIP